MIKLTKQQIQRANKLLDLLCKSGQIDGSKMYPLFKSKSDAEYVCSFLESEKLLSTIHAGPGIAKLDRTEKTCDCIENDRLMKEFRKDRKSVFSGNLTLISLIVSVVLNIGLIGNRFLTSGDPSKSRANLDAGVIRESKLNHVVDSLSVQNHNLQDKVIKLETEIVQLKQKDQN